MVTRNNDKEFDDLLKGKISAFSEEVPDIWAGIEKGIGRKRRWAVLRRASYAVAAAAACLIGGLFLFRDADVQVPQIVGVSAPVAEIVPTAEVAPIAEQIESFVKSSAVAKAEILQTTMIEQEETENQAGEAAADFQAAQPEAGVQAVQPSQPLEQSQPSGKSEDASNSKLLTEDELPAGFWDEDVPSKKRTHTSLSILSNLSAGASDEALSRIYKGGAPMHSASQTGKGKAASGVVPISSSPSFDMPLALGVQARIPIVKGFSAGIGLNLTYLVSQYDALINSVRYEGVYNQLWYVGVPVNLYYNFIDAPKFGAYAFAGGAAEKCVYQRYVFGSETLKEKVDGIQYSANVGIGLEYWFAPKMGIYADPSIVYYFDNLQPLSIRTQQPLQMRFEVGLRFKI